MSSLITTENKKHFFNYFSCWIDLIRKDFFFFLSNIVLSQSAVKKHLTGCSRRHPNVGNYHQFMGHCS